MSGTKATLTEISFATGVSPVEIGRLWQSAGGKKKFAVNGARVEQSQRKREKPTLSISFDEGDLRRLAELVRTYNVEGGIAAFRRELNLAGRGKLAKSIQSVLKNRYKVAKNSTRILIGRLLDEFPQRSPKAHKAPP